MININIDKKHILQKKASKWLEEKWPIGKRCCDLCGKNHWTISGDLVTPLLFVGGRLTVGGNAYPHILITCLNCGNAKYINAVVAGLAEGIKKDKSRTKTITAKKLNRKKPQETPSNSIFLKFWKFLVKVKSAL